MFASTFIVLVAATYGASGQPGTCTLDARGILLDARRHEAEFDTNGANELRDQILGAFGACDRPSPELREVAAWAIFDRVAITLAEGGRDLALPIAREAMRRFDSIPIDRTRLSPLVVAFLESARSDVSRGPSFRLEAHCLEPGDLWAEGRDLGVCHGDRQLELPVGAYRVWLVRGETLHVPVHVTESTSRVLLGARENPPSGFSPFYLLPFGGAQLVEDRPWFAASYFAAGMLALGWSTVETMQYSAARQIHDLRAEGAQRDQRRFAFATLIGVAVFSSLEGAIFALVR